MKLITKFDEIDIKARRTIMNIINIAINKINSNHLLGN